MCTSTLGGYQSYYKFSKNMKEKKYIFFRMNSSKDRKIDRKIYRQIDRQIDRQTDRWIDRQINI